MTYYGEYSTVTTVRNSYLDATGTSDDSLILEMIRQASRELEDITNRHYVPVIATNYFDAPLISWNKDILLDDDLLELTTLTNGDGSNIPVTEHKLYPLNFYPKQIIKLVKTLVQWQLPSNGDAMAGISVLGVWGYQPHYDQAWTVTSATLSAGITDAATSATVTTGKIVSGDLVKIDSEYIYVSAVTTGASDTLTIVRGVNGSTAAAHLIAAPLYRWDCGYNVKGLITRAAAGYYKVRGNPMSDAITVDGMNFTTPKDVNIWMQKQAQTLGLVRVGLA
jgi:hypothetical protein